MRDDGTVTGREGGSNLDVLVADEQAVSYLSQDRPMHRYIERSGLVMVHVACSRDDRVDMARAADLLIDLADALRSKLDSVETEGQS